MTHQPCCGLATSSTLRGSKDRLGGPKVDGQHPWAHALFPIGGIPPPFTGPSYCAARSFSPKTSPPVPPPPKPREPGGSRPSRVFPTPRVYSRASALDLWGTGNRVRVSPFTGGGGRHKAPAPTFGTGSRSIAAPTCPGRPTITPRSPPRVCWSGIERQPLSHRAPR